MQSSVCAELLSQGSRLQLQRSSVHCAVTNGHTVQQKDNDATLTLNRCYITQLMISPETRRCKLCQIMFERVSEGVHVWKETFEAKYTNASDLKFSIKISIFTQASQHIQIWQGWRTTKTLHSAPESLRKKAKVWISGCIPLPPAVSQTDADAVDRGQWVRLIQHTGSTSRNNPSCPWVVSRSHKQCIPQLK